jgi:hypothetical protein
MNVRFIISFILIGALQIGNAQDFVQLENVSGLNLTDDQVNTFNEFASSINNILQVNNFDAMLLYHLGMYIHHPHYESSINELIDGHISSLAGNYFVLARALNAKDGSWNIYLRMRYDEQDCINDAYITSVLDELDYYANIKNKNVDIYERELLVLNLMEDNLSSLFECCINTRQSCDFAWDNVNSEVYIDDQIYKNTELNKDIIALISVTPEMPCIGIKVKYNCPWGCPDFDFNAALKIYYARNATDGVRNRRDTITLVVDHLKNNSFYKFDLHSIVSINGQEFNFVQGGRVEIILSVNLPLNPPLALSQKYEFSIKGGNPNKYDVFAYIDANIESKWWFFKRVAVHESGSHGGIESEMKQFKPHVDSKEDLWSAWTNDSRTPLFGPPSGYGIMQLDNITPLPDKLELWNWQANIMRGYKRFKSIKTELTGSQGFLTRAVNRVNNWNILPENVNNPVILDQSIEYGSIKWVMGRSKIITSADISVINSVFSNELNSNEQSLIDAIILKRYNGLGSPSHDFWRLQNLDGGEKPIIEIVESAQYGNSTNYYVKSISTTKPIK